MVPTLMAVILLATSPAVGPQQPPTAGQSDDIVVTGQRLAVTQRELAACLARHCLPEQDIDATLAHAENQFVAGDYENARHTLLESIHRNKRYASRYPVAVSGLLLANARLAGHLGEGDAERIGMIDVISALKAGLDDDDPRVLEAKVELADTCVHADRIDYAERLYAQVRDKAERLHLPRIQGFAMLHLASLYQKLAAQNPDYRSLARDAIGDLTRSNDPQMATFALAGRVLEAQMSARQGDSKAIDDLIAAIPKATHQPVLLYAPAPKLPEQSGRAQSSGDVLTKMPTGDFDDQWVDIGFWIGPDGKVADADILRQSKSMSGTWPAPLITAIEGRRYTATAQAADDPGVFHVERYTYTAYWTRLAGSRIRQRSSVPEIEMLDLTAQPSEATRTDGQDFRSTASKST